MFKWVILFSVFGLLFFFLYHFVKFSNPYRLYVLFGRKGSGKSTFICKMAHYYKKKGRPVFTNISIPGTYGFDAKKLGKLHFPPESVVFIDEISLLYDNRNYKDFSDDAKAFLRLQRHYRVTMYVFSQTYDMDKKIRDQADYLYIVSNFMNCVSIARKISRKLCVVHADSGGTGESHIADDLDFTPWFTIPFGGAIFTWIPAWTKYFNSYDAPKLPLEDFVYYDERSDLYHVTVLDRLLSHLRRPAKRRIPDQDIQSIEDSDSKKDLYKEIDLFSDSPDGAGSEHVPTGSGRFAISAAGSGTNENAFFNV